MDQHDSGNLRKLVSEAAQMLKVRLELLSEPATVVTTGQFVPKKSQHAQACVLLKIGV